MYEPNVWSRTFLFVRIRSKLMWTRSHIASDNQQILSKVFGRYYEKWKIYASIRASNQWEPKRQGKFFILSLCFHFLFLQFMECETALVTPYVWCICLVCDKEQQKKQQIWESKWSITNRNIWLSHCASLWRKKKRKKHRSKIFQRLFTWQTIKIFHFRYKELKLAH